MQTIVSISSSVPVCRKDQYEEEFHSSSDWAKKDHVQHTPALRANTDVMNNCMHDVNTEDNSLESMFFSTNGECQRYATPVERMQNNRINELQQKVDALEKQVQSMITKEDLEVALRTFSKKMESMLDMFNLHMSGEKLVNMIGNFFF